MFDANATEFTIDNAVFLAQISELAYLEENQIREKLQIPQNSSNLFFITSDNKAFDTEVIILRDEKAIIIAFRGTEKNGIADWVSNLDNRLLEKFMGKIQQGFWEALADVWKKISEILDFFEEEKLKIWLTGHSQGGALAMLAARVLQEYNIQVQGVYTFGQPKTGDMLFANNYNVFLLDKTFRIYNTEDGIVKNPPNLYHAGTPVELKENGEITLKENFNVLESGGDNFTTILDTLFDFAKDGTNAHSLAEYLRRLQA
jgi:triacylglycerol lipase